MSTIKRIIATGNKPSLYPVETFAARLEEVPPSWIECADGFKMSVIAGWGTYCTPRPDNFDGPDDDEPYGPFTHLEVGFPSARPEPWDAWSVFCENTDEPTETVYGYVPAVYVTALIDAHGGEK